MEGHAFSHVVRIGVEVHSRTLAHGAILPSEGDDGSDCRLYECVGQGAGEVVDGEGRPAGTVEAVELVTVGQRRGMGHGSDGKRRYVTHVDVVSRRVTVGSAAEALRSSVVLAGPSLTWVDRPLAGGARAVAQVSAHGRPVPCTVIADDLADMEVRFDEPQRPVAPGQTVALYDALDPDAVVGAGIAA